MKRLLALAASALVFSACVAHGLSAAGSAALSQTVEAAAEGTALGLGAAAVSRLSGGCFASCLPGTVCNPKTGYCDELPCRGRCGGNERCDTSGVFPKCVSEVPDLQIEGLGDAPVRAGPESPAP
jgi:hypothetical protein